jgi:hypothetical protein
VIAAAGRRGALDQRTQPLSEPLFVLKPGGGRPECAVHLEESRASLRSDRPGSGIAMSAGRRADAWSLAGLSGRQPRRL